MADYGPYQVAICVYECVDWNEEYYDERRGNIKYSDSLITTCADDVLVARHEADGGDDVFVTRERLCVLPLLLRVPDLDEHIMRAGHCRELERIYPGWNTYAPRS